MKKKNFLAVLGAIALGCAVCMVSCTKDEPINPGNGNDNSTYERFVSGAVPLPEGVERTKLSENVEQMFVERVDQFKIGFTFKWDSLEVKAKKAIMTKSLADADTVVIITGKSSIRLEYKPDVAIFTKDSVGVPVISMTRNGQVVTVKATFGGVLNDVFTLENDSVFAKAYNANVSAYNAFTKVEFLKAENYTTVRDTVVAGVTYNSVFKNITYKVYHSSGDSYTLISPIKQILWKKAISHNPSGIIRWIENVVEGRSRVDFTVCEQYPNGEIVRIKAGTSFPTPRAKSAYYNFESDPGDIKRLWDSVVRGKSPLAEEWISRDSVLMRYFGDTLIVKTNLDHLFGETPKLTVEYYKAYFCKENDTIAIPVSLPKFDYIKDDNESSPYLKGVLYHINWLNNNPVTVYVSVSY